MKRKNKIALVAVGLVAASALSYTLVADGLEAAPVLVDLPVGKPAPNFRLNDVNGRAVTLSDYRGKTIVLEWNNPKCPTVKEHYESGGMQRAQAAATSAGMVWLTINSSAPGKQGHMSPVKAKAFTDEQQSRRTAYLLDPEGEVGRGYGAKATPHMYIINGSGTLVYNGGIADTASGRNHVTAALGELRAGKAVSVPMTRPYGCSVKYG